MRFRGARNVQFSYPEAMAPALAGLSSWGTLVPFRSNGVVVTGGDHCPDVIKDKEEIPSFYRGVHFIKQRRSVDSRACIQQNHEGHMIPCCYNAYSRCDEPTTKAPTSAVRKGT
ncbi:hypothetical protein MRX96_001348 [Rhipicephalus microplus]